MNYIEDAITLNPVKNLPNGWIWRQFNDGSGSLLSPDEKHYFSYDLSPYANEHGIEYKKNSDSGWNIFWGSFKEFKNYAENYVKEFVLC